MNIFNLNLYDLKFKQEYLSQLPNRIVLDNVIDEDFLIKFDVEFEQRMKNEENWKDPNSGFMERQKSGVKQNLMFHENYREDYNPSSNRMCDRLQNDLSDYPNISLMIEQFNSQQFIDVLSYLSEIKGIKSDPGRKSAGLHVGKRNGFIDIHCDHTWNQYINAYNCINMILFLNKNWKEDWNGQLEFWDQDCEKQVDFILPIWNRMVIWTNTTTSWHGYSNPLNCPEDVYRKSL